MDETPIIFVGTSRVDLRHFPADARQDTGKALYKLQLGGWPPDCKPLRSVGSGTFEIRVSDDGRAFRTLFVSKFKGVIYVLHAFEKKTRKTPRSDIDLARSRYKAVVARELEEARR